MLLSKPGALKQIGNKEFWQGFGKIISGHMIDNETQYFLNNSESFYGINFQDIFNKLNSFDKKQISDISKQIDDDADFWQKAKGKSSNGVKAIRKFGKWYFNKVTNASQNREFFLRYAVFKTTLSELQESFDGKTVSIENYGVTKKKMMDNFINEIENETDQDKKQELILSMATTFANQSLISYKDASLAVDQASKFYIPFLRFAEGNARLHYRMAENFVYNMRDSFAQIRNDKNFTKLAKTLGQGTYQSAIAFGVPMAIWNAVALAISGKLFGVDEDDIPEFAKDAGYMSLGPLYLSGTDVYSDLLSYIGMESLNNDMMDAIGENAGALFDKDKDFNLISDMFDAFTESMPEDLNIPLSFGQKMLSMLNPIPKGALEIQQWADYYGEEPVSVKGKYGYFENISRKTLQAVGLDAVFNAYQDMFGTPTGKTPIEYFGMKTLGSKTDAFDRQREKAYAYSEEVLGKNPYYGTGGDTERARMRNEIKNLMKYGKHRKLEKALEAYDEYLLETTTNRADYLKEWENLKTSLRNSFQVIPSSAISNAEMRGYIQSLSDEEYEKLKLAFEYRKDILGPYYNWLYGN
jgi:hypothetical protein